MQKRGSSRSKGVAKDESSDYDRRMPTAVLTNKNRASREDAPAHPAAKPAAASNSSGSSRPPRAPKQGPSSSPKQSPRVERSGSAVAPDQAAVLDKAVPSRGSSEERPERVRAGFGLYQPKRRGRLSGDEPDPAASEDSAAVAGATMHWLAVIGYCNYAMALQSVLHQLRRAWQQERPGGCRRRCQSGGEAGVHIRAGASAAATGGAEEQPC